MADHPLSQCEFFLLRYVPDAVKNEFINIGVVLVESRGKSSYADVRFTGDWRRVRCLDPGADIEMLEALEQDIRARLQVSPEQRAELMRQIRESLSNTVQLDEPKPVLAQEPARELDRLAKDYLETHRVPARESRTGRSAIYREMRDAFEQAGVWPLMMKNIPVAQYASSPDPLKIDCGYKPNGSVKLFHAVMLDRDAASSKVLAFSYPELRAGIQREHRAAAELTAVVPSYDESEEGVLFSLNVLRKSDIYIATAADLPALAARAREELRV